MEEKNIAKMLDPQHTFDRMEANIGAIPVEMSLASIAVSLAGIHKCLSATVLALNNIGNSGSISVNHLNDIKTEMQRVANRPVNYSTPINGDLDRIRMAIDALKVT